LEGYSKNNWRDTGRIIEGIQGELLEGYRENYRRDTARMIGGIQRE